MQSAFAVVSALAAIDIADCKGFNSQGEAFVEFITEEAANAAVENSVQDFNGREITIHKKYIFFHRLLVTTAPNN